MTPSDIAADDDFLAVALQAVVTDGGPLALDTLGWWDLLAHLDDPDSRTAVFAVLRAEGRELTSSAALGGILAQPYVEATGSTHGTVVATVLRTSPRRGPVHVTVGEPGDRALLVDRPGLGAWLVGPGAASMRALDVPGRLVLQEAEIEWSQAERVIAEDDLADVRRRSHFLGRLAIAAGILGSAEMCVALAVGHAIDREQFGQPIGRFQAVRHLLAAARTDCVALENVVREGVNLDSSAPPMYGEVAKALAGRNGRRACERALQVLGGIGFTAEHDHHQHHSRILALDALLGTSAELTHRLGVWLRSGGSDPRFAATILTAERS